MTDAHTDFTPTARHIADSLAVYLGPHTARVAVRTFAQRALGRGPDSVVPADAPALLEALGPVLRAFVGKERTASVLASIAEELTS